MEKTCSQIARLLTDTVPSIRSFRSASGILHPGIGLTKEMLGRTRRQVRAQIEPWRTYFLDMLESDAASPTPPFALADPASVTFSSQRVNGLFVWDALTAFTQAYQEIPVRKELTDLPVRYLMIRKTAEYPDALRGSVHGLLEFSVLRIFGERRETGEDG